MVIIPALVKLLLISNRALALSVTTQQINPFSQSEILFTPDTAPAVCRGRCLNGVSDYLQDGLGFASVVFKFSKGVVEGEADSVVGAVEGVWSIISDTKDFVVNIVHAGAHPKATALAIANAVSNYCTNDGNTNAESIGKCIGNAAGQIGMMFIGVGEAKEASIVAKGAEVAGQDAKFAELLKLIPKCSLVGRSLIKRTALPCAAPSTVAKAEEAIASTSSAVAKEGEIENLSKAKPARLKKPKMTPEERKAFQAQKAAEWAAEKARKTAELEANLAKKAAERAQKAALLEVDTVANGLPVATKVDGAAVKITYSKAFNLKHFIPDRGGLAGSTVNTVIKDASQVKFGAPVKGMTGGTGSNAYEALIFTSDAPVDLEVYTRNAAGVFEKSTELKQPLTVSGIIQASAPNEVLITHFEAAVVEDSTGVVTAITDDLGQDASVAALAGTNPVASAVA